MGSGKNPRLQKVRYPNGREVYSRYDSTSGSIGERLSQVKELADAASNGNVHAAYDYLGASVVAKVKYPQVVTNVGLVLNYGSDGSAGMDQFGRVTEHKWQTDSGSPAVKDHFSYGYDNSSNRLYRKNNVDPNFSELYMANDASPGAEYDGLSRLKDWKRGLLATGERSISSPVRSQGWTLDQVGNWVSNSVTVGQGSPVTQARTFNKANEVASIDTVTTHRGYDDAGNMTVMPDPNNMGGGHYACTYDAWNRLVKVEDGSSNVLEEMRYDGLNQRIAKLIPNSGSWDRTDYYYNDNWQVLQESFATGNKDTVAPDAKYQYVWDVRYIDAPALRDEDKDGDGDCGDDPGTGGSERLFYMQDANFNVTGLIGTTGTVVERYVYDAYGKATIYDDTWTNTKTWDNSAKNEVLYCGYRYDPKIGLYHVRNRYYHPVMGTWVQRDADYYENGLNTYAYVDADPIDYVDYAGNSGNRTDPGQPGFRVPIRNRPQGPGFVPQTKVTPQRQVVPAQKPSSSTPKTVTNPGTVVKPGGTPGVSVTRGPLERFKPDRTPSLPSEKVASKGAAAGAIAEVVIQQLDFIDAVDDLTKRKKEAKELGERLRKNAAACAKSTFPMLRFKTEKKEVLDRYGRRHFVDVDSWSITCSTNYCGLYAQGLTTMEDITWGMSKIGYTDTTLSEASARKNFELHKYNRYVMLKNTRESIRQGLLQSYDKDKMECCRKKSAWKNLPKHHKEADLKDLRMIE